MDTEQMIAEEAAAGAVGMQEGLDDALPRPVGLFTETALNSLVDAVNGALEAAGMEGAYPEFDGNLTELPPEFVRLLAMLNDASVELGLGDLGFGALEDDRDAAMLASTIAKLAASPEFQAGMQGPAPGSVPATPATPATPPSPGPSTAPPAVGQASEEALMMERM